MHRVLCTFGATYNGGTLRVLTDGLPHLNLCPGLQLAFGDLYERDEVKDVFRLAGLQVAEVGMQCPPYTSLREGLARQFDKFRSIPGYCRIAYRLRRAARRFDVLYVHTYKELVLAAVSGVPVVWHCHGLDFIPPFLARLAARCHRVIAISEAVAVTLREIGVSGDRIVTVLNAIDVDRVLTAASQAPVHPCPTPGARPVVLVPTASIRSAKGIHVVLQAVQDLPNIEVWIAGDLQDAAANVYLQHLFDLSRSLELRGRVHFMGFRADIYSLMRVADIVCIPSVYREGFGLAAAEAMALGKPVVVSNRGALPEVVQDGETGIVIDPDKPEQLTLALQNLIADPQYARKLGENAALAARQRFSYARWAESVGQVLRDTPQREI